MIDQPKTRPAAPPLTVKFFLKCGSIVDWPIPATAPAFALGPFVASIRSAGMFMTDDCYIPSDEIAIIALAGASAAIIQQPQHQRVQ